MVEPVEARVEFLEVHAIPAESNVCCLGFGVLAEMSFKRLLIEDEDTVVGAKCMQNRPVEDVLKRIVRAVVAGPSRYTVEVPAIIEVPSIELMACAGLCLKQLTLQEGPSWRCHRCRSVNYGLQAVWSQGSHVVGLLRPAV